MTAGPVVISFVGPSGSGKTTLIERLVPLLTASGVKVGTVKHAPHGHDVDKTGSDSSRHRAAGAHAVLLAGADGAVLFLRPNTAPDHGRGAHHQPGESERLHGLAALVATHMNDMDIVLSEGYAPVHDLLIAVRRSGVTPKVGNNHPAPWFTVTDTAGPDEYTFDQLDEIAARILTRCGIAHVDR